MAAADRKGHPTRNSLDWDETQALNYYGMLSLHEVFEIVGSQLTETDVEVLSFLLNETYSAPHPLDPAGWTVEPSEGKPDVPGFCLSPELLKTWRRIKPQSSQDSFDPLCKPTSGPELLLDLERRGYISDGNLEPLLQLLRVLTRHDLLPYVSLKKRRRGDDRSEVPPTSETWLLVFVDCHYSSLLIVRASPFVFQCLLRELTTAVELTPEDFSARPGQSTSTGTQKYLFRPFHSSREAVCAQY